MRIIEENIDGSMFDSVIFSEYFGGMRIAVADIETTGLSPANSGIILGGVVFPDGDNRRAVQYFGDTISDEAELLERYVGALSSADVIVTYNGDRFDLPFIRRRMESLRMDTGRLDGLFSVDMYRILKKYSHLPKLLPNMKQKTVESFLGDSSERTDEIDGAKSVELYYEYIKSEGERKEQILSDILLHNRDDIVRLSDMIRIVKILDLHEIMYSIGFPVAFSEVNIHIKNIKIYHNIIKVNAIVAGDTGDHAGFGNGYKIRISAAERSVELEIECQDIRGVTVVDLVSMEMDTPELQELGGYESGYLIIKEGKAVRHREANRIIKAVIQKALQ